MSESESEMKWISVKERLPEHGKRMLCVVIVDRVKFPTVWGWMGDNWSINCTEPMLRTHKDITHWLPLPESPSTMPVVEQREAGDE